MHFILLFPCIHTGHLLRKVFTAEPKPFSKIQKKESKPKQETSSTVSLIDCFFHLSNLKCVGASCGLGHRWLLTVQVMRWEDIGLVSSQGEPSVATSKASYSMDTVRLQEWFVSRFKEAEGQKLDSFMWHLLRGRMHLLLQTLVLCFSCGDPL